MQVVRPVAMIDQHARANLAKELDASQDEIDVSLGNLLKLDLIRQVGSGPNWHVTAFGRELLRTVAD
jgi:hypothetical protein